MKARGESARRSLRLMMAATLVAPLVVLAGAAWQHYRALSALADERIERSLDIAAEHAEKIFQAVEIALRSVDQITKGRTDQSLRVDQAGLSEALKAIASAARD